MSLKNKLILMQLVIEPLKITQNLPRSENAIHGEVFTLTCAASGYPAPKFTWFLESKEINSNLVSENGSLYFKQIWYF